MSRALVSGMLWGMLAPASTSAITPEQQQVAHELAAVLAWRLGPEAVQEWCQPLDPAGNAAREKAVKAWQEKYAEAIKTADQRVAEVVPLVYSAPDDTDPVEVVRRQVKELLFESLLQAKSPEEAKATCQLEAEADNPRLGYTRAREVQQSLAALYDWKIQLTPRN